MEKKEGYSKWAIRAIEYNYRKLSSKSKIEKFRASHPQIPFTFKHKNILPGCLNSIVMRRLRRKNKRLPYINMNQYWRVENDNRIKCVSIADSNIGDDCKYKPITDDDLVWIPPTSANTRTCKNSSSAPVPIHKIYKFYCKCPHCGARSITIGLLISGNYWSIKPSCNSKSGMSTCAKEPWKWKYTNYLQRSSYIGIDGMLFTCKKCKKGYVITNLNQRILRYSKRFDIALRRLLWK